MKKHFDIKVMHTFLDSSLPLAPSITSFQDHMSVLKMTLVEYSFYQDFKFRFCSAWNFLIYSLTNLMIPN